MYMYTHTSESTQRITVEVVGRFIHNKDVRVVPHATSHHNFDLRPHAKHMSRQNIFKGKAAQEPNQKNLIHENKFLDIPCLDKALKNAHSRMHARTHARTAAYKCHVQIIDSQKALETQCRAWEKTENHEDRTKK